MARVKIQKRKENAFQKKITTTIQTEDLDDDGPEKAGLAAEKVEGKF